MGVALTLASLTSTAAADVGTTGTPAPPVATSDDGTDPASATQETDSTQETESNPDAESSQDADSSQTANESAPGADSPTEGSTSPTQDSTPESAPNQAPEPTTPSADVSEPDSASSTPTGVAAQATAGHDPVGWMGAWTAGDGLIYFSGYAFDHDNLAATATTMYTLNGNIVAYQWAQLRSPDLDPYGLPYKGVFGAFQAPKAETNQVCMFVFNIGGGKDVLASCVNVNVPAKDPRGDIAVAINAGQIQVNGWLFDESNPTQSLATWVVDNGSLVRTLVSGGPSPYLYQYGVGGNHAFGTQFTPTTTGMHDICVYGINIGFGNNAWIKCESIWAKAPNDPGEGTQGAFVYEYGDNDGNGYDEIMLKGWAYDPISPWTSIQIGITANGVGPAYYPADKPSPFLAQFGIYGHHGIEELVTELTPEIPADTYEICMYGVSVLDVPDKPLQCESFTV